AAQCLAHFFRVSINAARRFKKKCAWHEFPRRRKSVPGTNFGAWHTFPLVDAKRLRRIPKAPLEHALRVGGEVVHPEAPIRLDHYLQALLELRRARIRLNRVLRAPN